jgi:hypothetical protein
MVQTPPGVIKHRATHTGWRRLRADQSTVVGLLKDTRLARAFASAMPQEPFPRDAIYFRWGRVQFVASGRTALLTVFAVALTVLAGRIFHVW